MLGGYQILDLRNIGLTLSASEKTITDADILDQLRNLREYIEKGHDYSKPLNNSPKCVLIRYRDAKNSEKCEACEFASITSSNNSLTYEIKAKGIIIEVVFEEKTNDDGVKYYDIKTAKYLYSHDETVDGDLEVEGDASVGGDVEVTGDASVGGDLSVTGDIGGDKISGNEIIENMTGYSFELGTKTNLTIDGVYSGAVKNGNKLTLVLAVDLTRTDTVADDIRIGTFTLPQEIADKIYPSRVGSNDYVDNRVINAWFNDSIFADLSSFVRKGTGADSNKLHFWLNVGPVNSKLTLDNKAYYRYELTILLSDNLIPQE